MHHSVPVEVLLASGVGILLFSACHDFAVRTVPNWSSVLLLCIGLALRLMTSSGGGIWWAVLIAAVVFLITFVFWRLGWMGGGDVKLLTAAALFVPPMLVPMLISGTAITGGVLALAYLIASKLVHRPTGVRPHNKLQRILRCEQWRLSRRGPLPYAAAIAVGGVIATLHV